MGSVSLSIEERKAYGIYSLLRKNALDANIETLKQISLYVARSTDDKFDISCDCVFKKNSCNENNDYYELLLRNGKKIIFSNNLFSFGFLILDFDMKNKIVMSSRVFERLTGDLTTVCVYSDISIDDFGKYVVTFRPNDLSNESLKYGTINYYTEDEVDWVYMISGATKIECDFDIVAKRNDIYPFAEKCYFELPLDQNYSELDCFDGYISNVLTRIDLLYDNVKVYMETRPKKRIKSYKI